MSSRSVKYYIIFSVVLLLSCQLKAQQCVEIFRATPERIAYLTEKNRIKQQLPEELTRGVVQLTGRNIEVGQKQFPNRTPADPVPFVDKATGEVYIYGTQVDGTGFSYLKYRSMNDLLRNVAPEIISRDVYLPNGQLARGKEAMWDTYRLSREILETAFSREEIERFYRDEGIDRGTDLYFAGIALRPDGKLGEWVRDNWRRRVHVLAEKNGKLQILNNPVFNRIAESVNDGDYIGHAYGPNFKLVRNGNKLDLWVISEEVTRKVIENGNAVDVTEIVARKMKSPFEASSDPADRVLLLSVNGPDGLPHPDSDRGPQLGHSKLIEGFRPTSTTPQPTRITKKEVFENGRWKIVDVPAAEHERAFLMTGSQGNFAGDGYDVLLAAHRGRSPIGSYEMVTNQHNGWKKYLRGLKRKYNLSWAGRGAFLERKSSTSRESRWYLMFHGVDKDLRPDGSYSGVIPPDTETYHRNIYMVPIEFYINRNGKVDMRLLY